MKKICFSLLNFVFINLVFSQEYNIEGFLKFNSNKNANLIEVTVKHNDSIIKSVVTDSNGKFNFKLNNGDYELQFFDFEKNKYLERINVDKQDIKKTFTIDDKQILLSELTINLNKKIVERKIDRLVYNIENSSFSNGFDLIEGLSSTPLVSVNNNTINIIGRSSAGIMINDKPVNLSGEALINYLATISTDNISSIEVITTPPSKYSANGNGGLINIKLKRNSKLGWNGMINTSYVQRKEPSYLSNFLINYSSNNTQLSATIGYNKQLKNTKDYSDFHFSDQLKNREEFSEKNNLLQNPFINLKSNFSLNKKNDIGFIIDLGKNIGSSESKNFSISRDLESLDPVFINRNLKNEYLISNIYHDFKIDDKGKVISTSINYLVRKNKDDRDFQDEKIKILTTNSDIKYNIFSGQVDFTLPFKKIKLETGIRYLNFDNKAKNRYIKNNYLSIDDFDYEENNYSIYTSIEYKLGKKIETKFGLRYENSEIKIPDLNRNFNNLFPTIYLGYKINKNNDLNFSYSKRVDRPNSENLNNFKNYFNTNSYTQGSQNLNPYFTNNLDINYTYKNNFNFHLYTIFKKNIISDYFFMDDEGTLVKTYKNYLSSNSYGFDLSYNLKIIKKLSTYIMWNSYYNKVRNSLTDNNGWSNYFFINNSFKINQSGTYLISANYWHYFPRKEDNMKWNSRGNLTLNLKMLFFEKSLAVNLSVRDLFNQDRAKFSNYIDNGYQDINNYFENRDVRLSISYLFGNKKIKSNSKQIKLEEKNRIIE